MLELKVFGLIFKKVSPYFLVSLFPHTRASPSHAHVCWLAGFSHYLSRLRFQMFWVAASIFSAGCIVLQPFTWMQEVASYLSSTYSLGASSEEKTLQFCICFICMHAQCAAMWWADRSIDSFIQLAWYRWNMSPSNLHVTDVLRVLPASFSWQVAAAAGVDRPVRPW